MTRIGGTETRDGTAHPLIAVTGARITFYSGRPAGVLGLRRSVTTGA